MSRAQPVAPAWGQYPIVALDASGLAPAGWVAPPSRAILGSGPVQFLGVYDTMPEADAWQPEVHRALQPQRSPGGVTLRWSAPRQTVIDGAGAVQTLAPAWRNALALSLYVGGLDVLPPAGSWHRTAAGAWPGAPVGTLPFAFGKGATASPPQQWQTGLAFTRPRAGRSQLAVPGNSGAFGTVEAQDGFAWLCNFGAVPALELLSYFGQPWAEADLWELAGGTRYVAAWLRLWWSRFEGADDLAAARYFVPYTIGCGRPLAPCHRDAWHTALPVLGPAVPLLADVYDDGVRYGVASPISGTWRVGVECNGDAADAGVHVGLELRGSTILARSNATILPTAHGTILGPTTPHGGVGVISCGYPTEQDAALIHVAVTRA